MAGSFWTCSLASSKPLKPQTINKKCLVGLICIRITTFKTVRNVLDEHGAQKTRFILTGGLPAFTVLSSTTANVPEVQTFITQLISHLDVRQTLGGRKVVFPLPSSARADLWQTGSWEQKELHLCFHLGLHQGMVPAAPSQLQ